MFKDRDTRLAPWLLKATWCLSGHVTWHVLQPFAMHEQEWGWLPMLLALVASEDHALAPGTCLQHHN